MASFAGELQSMMSIQKRHTRQFLKLFLNANIISPARTVGIARAAEIHFHDGQELTSGRPRFLASGVHPASYPRGTGVLSRGQSGRGVMLITHLHLQLRLTMSRSIILLLLYFVTVRTGTTSPLTFPRYFAKDGTFISLVPLLLVITLLIFHS